MRCAVARIKYESSGREAIKRRMRRRHIGGGLGGKWVERRNDGTAKKVGEAVALVPDGAEPPVPAPLVVGPSQARALLGLLVRAPLVLLELRQALQISRPLELPHALVVLVRHRVEEVLVWRPALHLAPLKMAAHIRMFVCQVQYASLLAYRICASE